MTQNHLGSYHADVYAQVRNYFCAVTHCSIVCDSQRLETTQMAIKKNWLNK